MRRARPIDDLRPHRALKKACRRRAGTAMVEATIVAPVLVLLLFGATYVRELYVARASMRLTARNCAWHYALRGCQGEAPAECSPSVDAVSGEGLPNVADVARQTGDGVDPFSDIPVLGETFRMLFGTSTRATATVQVPYPLDDQRVGVASAESVVLCNSVRTDVFDIAKRWLCDRLGC